MSSHTTENEIVYDAEGNPHEVVDFHNDYTGAKFGFWLFLFTELMLFGGMFLILTYYFYRFPVEFMQGSAELDIVMGGVNTFVLLFSTYFMGLTLVRVKEGEHNAAIQTLGLTIGLATAFLVIKYFEWTGKIHHGIYPDSDIVNAFTDGKTLFFGLYYTMTGLHGLHVIVGIFVMIWLLWLIKTGRQNRGQYVTTENVGLYWDLVHIVWIFLFPLFYLVS